MTYALRVERPPGQHLEADRFEYLSAAALHLLCRSQADGRRRAIVELDDTGRRVWSLVPHYLVRDHCELLLRAPPAAPQHGDRVDKGGH